MQLGGAGHGIVANNNITNMINEWAFLWTAANSQRQCWNHPFRQLCTRWQPARDPRRECHQHDHVDGMVFPAGTIIDDTVYFETNNTNANVAVALSRGYLITGNSLRTHIATVRWHGHSDRRYVATGGTNKTYTKWSDYGDTDPVGLGWMFLRTGWVNPQPVVSDQMSVEQAFKSAAAVIRDVMITNNQFRGLDSAVYFYLCQPKDVFVRSNLIVDCGTSFGAIMVNLEFRSSIQTRLIRLLPAAFTSKTTLSMLTHISGIATDCRKVQWNTSAPAAVAWRTMDTSGVRRRIPHATPFAMPMSSSATTLAVLPRYRTIG